MGSHVPVRVGERPAIPHPNQGEKLVEHVVRVNSKASTPQVLKRNLPLNSERREIEAQCGSARLSKSVLSDIKQNPAVPTKRPFPA